MIEEINIDEGYFHNIRAFLEIPEGKPPFSTIIICHGLTANPIFPVDSDSIYHEISKKLTEAGFLTVRFNFTMNLKEDIATFHIKSEEHDLKEVMKELLDNERVNKKRIGAVGHSFGGTILLLTAHENKRLKAIATISPKFELGEGFTDHPWHLEAQEKGYFTHTDHQENEHKISKEFLEENFKHNKRLKKAIKKIKAPLLLIYGTNNEEEVAESEAIKKLAKHAQTIPIEGADEKLSNTTSLTYASRECVKFFVEKL
ncbi:MAG: alpha/beta fold hydrolase [Nanoarchaeota archaeon]|nr:alpha/beta fold hydrolase [Nanoarchaeota archaeon]MBU1854287.1 alpha/beta fold hydrolase [Nanoarchaeota archaeon]